MHLVVTLGQCEIQASTFVNSQIGRLRGEMLNRSYLSLELSDDATRVF